MCSVAHCVAHTLCGALVVGYLTIIPINKLFIFQEHHEEDFFLYIAYSDESVRSGGLELKAPCGAWHLALSFVVYFIL
jgi:hypothetical protein